MLNGIKSMINAKKSFQEAAEIILEDASGTNLDDLIVLGEDTDLPEPNEDDDNNNDNVENEPEDNSSNDNIIPEDNNKTDNNSSNDGIMDTPIADNEGDGLEEPLPVPGDDTLPTPVGKQTGEPIDDIDNILDMSIDLKSNTAKDILPVPPVNAGEAIASDDILSQKIDSGFSNEENPENPELPNEDEGNDLLSEAITLDDSNKSESEGGSDEGTEESSSENGSTNEEGSKGEESIVTSAVRDKVNEADTEESLTDDLSDNSNSKKDDLLKKLGNITKNIEDAKKAVMDSL